MTPADALLLVAGHMVGDFVVQNDWMGSLKSTTHPGPPPDYLRDAAGKVIEAERGAGDRAYIRWIQERRAYYLGYLVCFIHCLVYTGTIWLFSVSWMPWWAAVVVFVTHYPVDRWRLARVWMMRCGQRRFATGDLAPWSVIVVDQTIHLATLAALAKFVEVM